MFALAKFAPLMGGGGLSINAVDFDGTNDYLTRGAGLTGAADSKQGTFSAWFRFDGGDGNSFIVFSSDTTLGGGGVRFFVQRTSAHQFAISGRNSAGGTILSIATTAGTYAASSTWLNVLVSWDLATAGARHIYINDVSDLTQTTFTNDTMDHTLADWSVGATAGGSSKLDGCLAELFFHTAYIDLSNSTNRRKFITATGKPESLGSDGSLPLGVQPLIYLNNPAASFGTNKGTGGNFTINGTLDAASSSPSG